MLPLSPEGTIFRGDVMIRSYALAAVIALIAFPGIAARAADPLPSETHKVLTLAVALEAAQAAVAACKAQGYNVTVTVADRLGAPKVVLMGDGAGSLSREVTRRKAYTAATLRVSTGEYTQRVQTPGAFNPGMYDPQLATGLGGLPIKVGNDTIGAIAAAGAPGGDKDEACASAGLDKIKDQLK
jgi:uncharacterized protein GlcG (DUF336 family)